MPAVFYNRDGSDFPEALAIVSYLVRLQELFGRGGDQFAKNWP